MEKEFNFNFSFKVQVPQFIVAAWQGRGRVVRGLLRQMVPNVGTMLVTTLLVTALIYAQSVGAVPWAQSLRQTGGSSTTTINYQGRLADSAGEPIEGNVGMEFALYDAQTGGTLLWGPEGHTAVPVSGGLFSVKLGSVEEGGIPASILGGDVWLEVTVGGETLTPRERLGAVPYALQALTVPDGAITTEMIKDGAVTQEKAPSLIAAPLDNRSCVVNTWVGAIDADGLGTIDISHYGFSHVDGVVVVNGDDGAGMNIMVNVEDWSTTQIRVRAWRNGAPAPDGLFRVNYAIMGMR